MRIPVEEMAEIVNDLIYRIRSQTRQNKIYVPKIDFNHYQEEFQTRGFALIIDAERQVFDNGNEEPGWKCHLIPIPIDRMEWDFIQR